MAGPGQEAWNHACELCWIYTLPDGRKGEFEFNLLSLFLFNWFSLYSIQSQMVLQLDVLLAVSMTATFL